MTASAQLGREHAPITKITFDFGSPLPNRERGRGVRRSAALSRLALVFPYLKRFFSLSWDSMRHVLLTPSPSPSLGRGEPTSVDFSKFAGAVSERARFELRKNNSGFTLLELVISMTLVGLLSIAIHLGFRIGLNAWAKGNGGLERARTVQSTMDVLSRQIASIVPYVSQQKIKDVQVEVPVFQETEGGMRFVTTFSSQSRSAGGLRLVEYFFAESNQRRGKALLMNERVLPVDEALPESVFRSVSREDNSWVVDFFEFGERADSAVLIEGLDQVHFSYVHPRTSAGSSSAPGSQKKEFLPLGVEIKLHWDKDGPFLTKDFSIVIPIPTAL
jgi:prepilin-type N-terminal cleavage/methylation domain-containing protein